MFIFFMEIYRMRVMNNQSAFSRKLFIETTASLNRNVTKLRLCRAKVSYNKTKITYISINKIFNCTVITVSLPT